MTKKTPTIILTETKDEAAPSAAVVEAIDDGSKVSIDVTKLEGDTQDWTHPVITGGEQCGHRKERASCTDCARNRGE